jgi:hypothetical protein
MSKKAPLDVAYRFGPDIAWRRIGDESVVLNLKSSAYYTLNETAALLWETLGEGLPPHKAVERLCAEFDAEPAAVSRDVEAALAELLNERLILRSDA